MMYITTCYTHNTQFPHLLNPHSPFCHHTVMNAECIEGLPLALRGDTETCFLDKQWLYSSVHQCHPGSLCNHRSGNWQEYRGHSHSETDQHGKVENLEL